MSDAGYGENKTDKKEKSKKLTKVTSLGEDSSEIIGLSNAG